MIRNIDPMVNKNKRMAIVSWQAPQFIYYQKKFWWYAILVLVGLGLATLFYFIDDLLGIIMVALAMLVFIVTSAQKPKKMFYKIGAEGITIDEKIYPFSDFKSFYITYTNGIATLHLTKIKKISVPISLILENVDEGQVLALIKKFLPENTKIKYSTSDILSKWFRF